MFAVAFTSHPQTSNYKLCLFSSLSTSFPCLDQFLNVSGTIFISVCVGVESDNRGWRHGWRWERCAAWLELLPGWRHDDVHRSQRQAPPPHPQNCHPPPLWTAQNISKPPTKPNQRPQKIIQKPNCFNTCLKKIYSEQMRYLYSWFQQLAYLYKCFF